MRSLRSQLTVIVAGLALLAVAAVTVIVAVTTNDSIEETLDEQRAAREVIIGELNEFALRGETWEEAEDIAVELAEEYRARIVLADIDGFLLLDTGDGELPPLEGVIDPFGPLGEFTEDFAFDTETFDKALVACLDEEGVPYRIDDFNELFLPEDEASEDAIDACFEEAVELAEENTGGVKEPALLFLGFDASPTIPWVAIGVVASAAIALAAIAAASMSGLITRPLRRLSGAARSVSEGNLDVTVEADSPTEVAELATSFNDMTSALALAESRRKQVTADVAHELRSPLTNILGHLDAMSDGVIEPSLDQVEIITSEAARLAHLVDDLQTLAALDEHTLVLNRQPIEVCDVIDRTLEARRARAREASITMGRRDECCAPITVDAARIAQIVGNLIDNALEHTPTGGNVMVAIEDAKDDVTISVMDTGPGIDPDLLPRIFDRLSRADAARSPGSGGRGLGLAISRGLARAHGGDLEAANHPDSGAVFTLTLPRRPGGEPQS